MNILVTGAAGFLGRILVENLKNIRDGKNRTRPQLSIKAIYEYDINNTQEELNEWCKDCDFVSTLLNTLKKNNNICSVMLSSSVQATLTGRFGMSEYSLRKQCGNEIFNPEKPIHYLNTFEMII